MYTVPS